MRSDRDFIHGTHSWSLDTLATGTAVTSAGNGGAQSGFGSSRTLRAQLNVTAITGTSPSLTVLLEDTLDGGATWNTIGSFNAATAVGRQVINVTSPFSQTVRASWTITGTTPSADFTVVCYSE